jgi:hypothetical protein
VLDSQGRLVDALPGLYGPGAFLELLGGAEFAARQAAGLDDKDFAGALREYHRTRLAGMKAELTRDLRAVGSITPEMTAGLTLEYAQLGTSLVGSPPLPVKVPRSRSPRRRCSLTCPWSASPATASSRR